MVRFAEVARSTLRAEMDRRRASGAECGEGFLPGSVMGTITLMHFWTG
jgi:hypothetical protein